MARDAIRISWQLSREFNSDEYRVNSDEYRVNSDEYRVNSDVDSSSYE
jgi:hypothetical protein